MQRGGRSPAPRAPPHRCCKCCSRIVHRPHPHWKSQGLILQYPQDPSRETEAEHTKNRGEVTRESHPGSDSILEIPHVRNKKGGGRPNRCVRLGAIQRGPSPQGQQLLKWKYWDKKVLHKRPIIISGTRSSLGVRGLSCHRPARGQVARCSVLPVLSHLSLEPSAITPVGHPILPSPTDMRNSVV